MADRLAQLLGVLALAVADRVQDAAGDDVLPEPEADALVHLAAWPGTTLGGLAEIVGRSQPATVRLVDRLVERGFVVRGPGPDRRTLGLAVTDAGGAAADAFLDRRGDALAPMLDALGARDRARLEPVLERLVAGLADDRVGAVRACRQCDRDACGTGDGCPLDHTTVAERHGGRPTRRHAASPASPADPADPSPPAGPADPSPPASPADPPPGPNPPHPPRPPRAKSARGGRG